MYVLKLALIESVVPVEVFAELKRGLISGIKEKRLNSVNVPFKLD
jgi:hypothetical protein